MDWGSIERKEKKLPDRRVSLGGKIPKAEVKVAVGEGIDIMWVEIFK